MLIYCRKCNECGHVQVAKPPAEYKGDSWKDLKCKVCKSSGLDYGSDSYVLVNGNPAKARTFKVEVTDTFGGDANYAWVRRYEVQAADMAGAADAMREREGGEWEEIWAHNGGDARYDMKDACICCFIEEQE